MASTVVKYIEGTVLDFESLKPLDCFKYRDWFYIKTSITNDCDYNAIMLNSPDEYDICCKFDKVDEVTLLKAEIIIKSI